MLMWKNPPTSSAICQVPILSLRIQFTSSFTCICTFQGEDFIPPPSIGICI